MPPRRNLKGKGKGKFGKDKKDKGQRPATSASFPMRSSARASSRCCPIRTCTEPQDESAMQVILMEKVANLGELGDVVKVKDGYARNFLIPHGKAKRATDANLREFEQKRSVLEKAQAESLARAQERGAKLEGFVLQITQKAGVDGRL